MAVCIAASAVRYGFLEALLNYIWQGSLGPCYPLSQGPRRISGYFPARPGCDGVRSGFGGLCFK